MKKLIFFGSIISLFFACKKIETYPDTPVIEFKEYVKTTDPDGLDDSLKLTITFKDGDGDLGFRKEDTLPPFDKSPYYYNFVYDLFIKESGAFKKYPLDPAGFRMPYLTPPGNNKNIKGEISVKVFLKPDALQDTIYYELYIYDRALHKSNVVRTPEIIINTRLP